MKEPACVLHNSGVPPRSVISYQGVISYSGVAQSDRRKVWKRAAKPPEIIAFKVVHSDRSHTAREILIRLGITDSSNPESTLAQLIDKRADELLLPDGCAVIDYQPAHVQKWQDELAQLAVLCKSSANVWLRSKEPRLSSIDDRHSVSLFLPFGIRD